MKTFMVLVVATFLLSLPAGSNGQTISFGTSYLNQTLDVERLGNLLTQDFSFQLDAPDAAGMYRARLHDDAVIWQRLEAGPRYGNIQAFYSLDLKDQLQLSGGGIRISQTQGMGRSFSVTGGLYDRGFCAEAVCSVERNGFVGRVGYEFRKIQDLRWFGPSVSIGWRW